MMFGIGARMATNLKKHIARFPAASMEGVSGGFRSGAEMRAKAARTVVRR
jgi:hypothetical protein